MQQFVVFITKHWVLASLIAVALLAFLVNEFIHRRLATNEVSPEQAIQLINHQEAVVFDIRSESLYAAGHILGAEWASSPLLDKKIETLKKFIKKPIIVVSALGHDSSKVTEKLKEKGFLQVVVLNGGMQAWKAAGLPMVKA